MHKSILFTLDVVSGNFPSRVPFLSLLYIMQSIPTIIQCFLNAPGHHSVLWVKSWYGVNCRWWLAGDFVSLSTLSQNSECAKGCHKWPIPKRTQKYFLRSGALVKVLHCEEPPQENRGGCDSTILSLAQYSGPRLSTCSVASHVACPKNNHEES